MGTSTKKLPIYIISINDWALFGINMHTYMRICDDWAILYRVGVCSAK